MPPDPLGPAPRAFVLAGKLVTMDPAYTVIDRGWLCIDAGRIAALGAEGQPLPPAFATAPVIETGGVIYPGLIELHNHLSYNVLPPWQVPQRFSRREEWLGLEAKAAAISGPMALLSRSPGYTEAVVRYVECKCLVAGVTTSQGLTLQGAPGIVQQYRGLVRNVEQTGDPDLPEAVSRVSDIANARDLQATLDTLQAAGRAFILHLSEGTDEIARGHFTGLRLPDGSWALNRSLVGIHATALHPEDFDACAQAGAAMVWSPLSNYLLYGATAAVAAARDRGVRIGLGSDWSPTGSKNLLGELKMAKAASRLAGGIFSDRELVEMATAGAAAILGWDGPAGIGRLATGKRADLMVLDDPGGDPYAGLIAAHEGNVRLVVIDGVRRYGLPELMAPGGPALEPLTVGGRGRSLYLQQATADPIVLGLSLAEATRRLAAGLAGLPHPPAVAAVTPAPAGLGLGPAAAGWTLVLDNDGAYGETLRGPAAAPFALAAAARPLSEIVTPLTLDPLTVVDDPSFSEALSRQPNLPAELKAALLALY